MKLSYLISSLVIVFLGLVTVGFLIFSHYHTMQPQYHPGGPYYYKSFASYVLPMRPVGEISEQEAKELEKNGFSYYEAYFNQEGFITRFVKHFGGKILFEEEYIYDENGILKDKITHKSGETANEVYFSFPKETQTLSKEAFFSSLDRLIALDALTVNNVEGILQMPFKEDTQQRNEFFAFYLFSGEKTDMFTGEELRVSIDPSDIRGLLVLRVNPTLNIFLEDVRAQFGKQADEQMVSPETTGSLVVYYSYYRQGKDIRFSFLHEEPFSLATVVIDSTEPFDDSFVRRLSEHQRVETLLKNAGIPFETDSFSTDSVYWNQYKALFRASYRVKDPEIFLYVYFFGEQDALDHAIELMQNESKAADIYRDFSQNGLLLLVAEGNISAKTSINTFLSAFAGEE